MPSWSVRYAGPMNDQQIQDIISYLVELNREAVGTGGDNLCLHPPSDTQTAEDTPTETPGQDGTPCDGTARRPATDAGRGESP